MRVVCLLVYVILWCLFFCCVGVACVLFVFCILFVAVVSDSCCRVLLIECSSLWLFVCLLSMVSRVMSVVACCLSFVARCLLFVVCGYSVCVVVSCCLCFVVSCVLGCFVFGGVCCVCSVFGACWSLIVVRRLLFVVCRLCGAC